MKIEVVYSFETSVSVYESIPNTEDHKLNNNLFEEPKTCNCNGIRICCLVTDNSSPSSGYFVVEFFRAAK
jgi:hypothetical protein